MLKKLRKKGSIVDVAFLIVVLLGFSIFFLIVAKVFPTITNQISLTEIGSNEASVSALESTENTVGEGDMVFLFIFTGLVMAIFITSFFIDSSPILIPVYIIALALLLIFSAVSENVYHSFSEHPTFSEVSPNHPVINYIMEHLFLISIAVGVLSMILIFAKPRGYSGGGF